jgi:leader peptidase (prepilin peptidase)/N-methyltransferase
MFDGLSLFSVLAAPFAGSFLGLLVARLPQRRDVVWSRSACEHCRQTLVAADLVPILSWIGLRGRCRHCGHAIGTLPLAMELAALALALWAASETQGWVFLASCGLGWALLTLAVIDARHFLLPDVLTLPLVAAGLFVAYAIAPASLPDHAIATAAGFLGALALAWSYRALRGREGLGMGDAKLLAAAGAWVGLEGLPTTILLGAVLGLVFVLGTALTGRRLAAGDKIPLGTFLAAGLWLVWLYGPLVPAR